MGRSSGGSGGGGGFTNPMTTLGDLIQGGTGGAAQRLAIGTNGAKLQADFNSDGQFNWVALAQSYNYITSPVSLSATTDTDITSLSIGAGDWFILCSALLHYSSATANVDVWFGSGSHDHTTAIWEGAGSINSTSTYDLVTFGGFITVGATATYYLSAYASAACQVAASSPGRSLQPVSQLLAQQIA